MGATPATSTMGKLKDGFVISIFSPETGENRFDCGSCCADEDHDSWATVLCFKKVGDEGDDGHVHMDDEFGIFSVEDGRRLDIGGCSCDMGHDSWATQLEVRSIEGGRHIRYNQPVALYCTDDSDKRVDIGSAVTDAGHESWATKLGMEKIGRKKSKRNHFKTIQISCPELDGDKILDMGPCNADGGHDSWATLLVLKKQDDEDCDSEVDGDDNFGIFSSENGTRLDIGVGSAHADYGHESWATVFNIEQQNDDGALCYNQVVKLVSAENGNCLDIGASNTDGGHWSWATNFNCMKVD